MVFPVQLRGCVVMKIVGSIISEIIAGKDDDKVWNPAFDNFNDKLRRALTRFRAPGSTWIINPRNNPSWPIYRDAVLYVSIPVKALIRNDTPEMLAALKMQQDERQPLSWWISQHKQEFESIGATIVTTRNVLKKSFLEKWRKWNRLFKKIEVDGVSFLISRSDPMPQTNTLTTGDEFEEILYPTNETANESSSTKVKRKTYGIFLLQLAEGIKVLYSGEIDAFYGNDVLELKTGEMSKPRNKLQALVQCKLSGCETIIIGKTEKTGGNTRITHVELWSTEKLERDMKHRFAACTRQAKHTLQRVLKIDPQD